MCCSTNAGAHLIEHIPLSTSHWGIGMATPDPSHARALHPLQMGLTPAQPILPLESNLPLAVIATVLFLVFSALFAVDNSSQARKLAYAAVASLSVGFGSVYITNAVHVYTG